MKPNKKLINEKALEAMKKAAVFERHQEQRFNEEWGHGGVTISCGARHWLVHIPCDPTYGGSIDTQERRCVVCDVVVPEEIQQAFDIKFYKPQRPWVVNQEKLN